MKASIVFFVIAIICIGNCSCSIRANSDGADSLVVKVRQEALNTTRPQLKDSVYLFMEKEQLAPPLDSVVVIMFNNTDSICETSTNSFSIQRKENGKWVAFPKVTIRNGIYIVETSLGCAIGAHHSWTFALDLSQSGFEKAFTKGEYRIKKRYFFNKNSKREKYAYCNFCIK